MVFIRRITLTPRQENVVKFIRGFWELNGFGPTKREIAAALKVSSTTIYYELLRLHYLGYIKKYSNIHRSLKLAEAAPADASESIRPLYEK